MSKYLTVLSKLENVLLALLAAQAVIVAFFPQTPTVVEWTSRVFGVIAVVSGIIKAILAQPNPPAA